MQTTSEYCYVATCPDCDGWVMLCAICGSVDADAEKDATNAWRRGLTVVKRPTAEVQDDLRSGALTDCTCNAKRRAAADKARKAEVAHQIRQVCDL